MIVNRGFSFSNMVGIHSLQPCSRTLLSGAEDMEIVAIYPGKMKKLYSLNSYDESSIAYQFAAVDIGNTVAILDFCNSYGLLYSSRLENNVTNDYMFSQAYDSIFSEPILDFTPDKLYLSTFRREAINMRRFLGLKASLDAEDIVSIVYNLIQLLLSYTAKSDVPSDTETEHFNFYFYVFVRYKKKLGIDSERYWDYFADNCFDIQSAVIDYRTTIKRYVHATPECGTDPLFGKARTCNDMFHNTWQRYFDILDRLQTVCTFKADVDGESVTFEPKLTESNLSAAGITYELISLAAYACISDIMYSQTGLITPKLQYENGKLVAEWHITSLLEAMYMELMVTFAPNTQIKKCSNPTCNFYFDVGVGNAKKIYCSQRCATLMAKRRQRARAKTQ